MNIKWKSAVCGFHGPDGDNCPSCEAAQKCNDHFLETLRDEIEALKKVAESAKVLVADVQVMIEDSKHCGDPNYECPMQDIFNPGDVVEHTKDLIEKLKGISNESL